jgi:hypothetical protein
MSSEPRKPSDRTIVIVIGLIVLGIVIFGIATDRQALQAILNAFAGSTANSNTNSPGSTLTFTDQNKYYQMDVPAGWIYKAGSGDHYYFDQFKSPDGNALIENLVYDEGAPLAGPQLGQTALQLLDQFYGGGQSGTIQLSDDSPQQDGSERLTWTLSSGNRSGVSFLEVRNNKTILLLTVEWANDYKSQYMDILDKAASSYRTP